LTALKHSAQLRTVGTVYKTAQIIIIFTTLLWNVETSQPWVWK